MTHRLRTIDHNIAPPLRSAITLVHKSGIVVYVAQSQFGPKGAPALIELVRVAQLIAPLMEQ